MVHSAYLLDMHERRSRGGRNDSDSYIEVRMILFIGLGILALVLILPAILRAVDLNDDNLDDTWEAQYGITTNAYALTNLVGWWQMQPNSTNVMADSSTNHVSGTLISFPTNPYGAGLFSNALYFSASGQVNFPSNGVLNTTTNQFTFSAWFQATNNLNQPATIATWTDAQTNSWSVGAGTNGVAGITFSDAAGDLQTIGPATGALQLYDGTWHQVAVTYNTNQIATVYVDGQNEASGMITNWASGPVASFTLGVPNTGSTNQPYALDDTRLYNRALGPNEVTQLPVTYTDLNGSGLTVYDDYLEVLNPLSTNDVVTSGFIDSGLIGYYGSSSPTLTKSSGDGQVVAASTFATNPLVVHVANSSGTALVGAPITFAIASGSDGGVALSSGGTTTTSLSLTTDSSGNATVYYESGPDAFKTNTITAMAVSDVGSVSVSFTATCGVQSGLAMWLRADQGVTSSGGAVSQWNDQTSNGNNVVPDASGHNPQLVTNAINGEPGISFDGVHQCLTRSSYTGLPTGNSDRTILIVARYDGPGYGGGLNYGTTSLYHNCITGVSSDGACYIGDWGGGPEFGPSVIETGYLIETANSQSGTVSLYNDGGLLGSAAFAYATATSGSIYLGTDAADNVHIKQTICEIIVYNRALSGGERGLVESYLADKYGIYDPNATWPSAYSSAVQTLITANQWTKAQADAYVAFLATSPPVPASGLQLWLRADQGVTSSSGNVSQWVDQGPAQESATQTTTGNQPQVVTNVINGEPVIRFNGSSDYMQLPPGFTNASTGVTAFAVFTPTPSTANYPRIFDFGNGQSSDNLLLCQYPSQATMQFYDVTGTSTVNSLIGGNELLANTPQEYTAIKNGSTSMSLYRNGTLVGQTTSGLTALNNILRQSNYIGKSNWTGNVLYQGDMAEILVYNRPLTSGEQEQVEVYLADKYGLYNPNATWPSAYSSAIQTLITTYQWTKAQADAYVAFVAANPSLPAGGLALWLKADAGVTANGSGNVSQWVDQSPSGHIATQTTGTNEPQLVSDAATGKPALQFSGNQWISGGDLIPAGDDITIITVDKTSDTSSFTIAASLGTYTSTADNGAVRGVGYRDNQPEFDLANGSSQAGAAPPTGVSNINTTTFSRSSGNVSFYTNSALSATGTISGVSATNLTPGFIVGGASWSSNYWSGAISEVLVYDHVLSESDQEEAEGYLADKYGLYNPNASWPLAYSSDVQAEISRNQWTEAQANKYVALQSNNPGTMTNGLLLWLKADAGVMQDGSGNVNSWTDQTGNYTVSQSGSSRPIYIANDVNGGPALRFNGSQCLFNPASIGVGVNGDVTMIAVASTTNPTAEQFSAYLGDTAEGTSRGIGYSSTDETFSLAYNDYWGISAPSPGTFVAEETTLNSSRTSVTFYRNGSETSSSTVSGAQNITPGISIGAYDGYGAPWQGDIAEVLVYDHKLSSDELAEVDGYLADKYGINDPNASWPLAYSSSVQTEITKHQWNKAQADAYVAFQAANSTMLTTGLTMWFKADDASKLAKPGGGTLSNGDSISSWTDETGNYVVSQSNSFNQPSYVSSDLNGKAGLHFSGSQWLSSTVSADPGLQGDITVINVGMTTAPSAQTYSLDLGNGSTTGVHRALGFLSGNEIFDTFNISCSGGSAPASGTFLAQIATLDPTISNVTFYQNGAVSGNGSLSGVQALDLGITIGAIYGGTYNWQGDIVEQLVYDHKLSPTELQQVSLYLSNKYGLPYSAAIDITPSAGSYTSSQTVSMTTAISGGTIHYTLDGTQPTANSPTYSSSITVSASALVQAVVTVAGNIVSPLAAAQYYINDSGQTGLPITPTSFTAASISGSETDLAWTLSGMLNYSAIDVYRSTNGGAYVLIDVLDPSSTSYQDLNVTAGNSYTYEVGTLNQSGVSDTTASSSITPPGDTALTITVTTPSGAVPLP